jgi:hypothetical protein
MKRLFWVTVSLMALTACGEKPQELVHTTKDATAFSGTGKAFVGEGWKAGDKASWESQLKARAQYGQNDFSRMN